MNGNPPTIRSFGYRGFYSPPRARKSGKGRAVALSSVLATALCAAAAYGGFHLFTIFAG